MRDGGGLEDGLDAVRRHWEQEPCDSRYGRDAAGRRAFFDSIEAARYAMEPYISSFAGFSDFRDRDILEIGVGAGTDFSKWVDNGARAVGVDLAWNSLGLARERLTLAGRERDAALLQADAQRLPFKDSSFDLVYSWGAIHHTPEPRAAFAEAFRVLRPGGELRAMVYHPYCWTSAMLWTLHALFKGRPWTPPRRVVFEHLESPGTKCYTETEAAALLESVGFRGLRFERRLGPADLLLIAPGPKHRGPLFSLAKALYPRPIIRLLGGRLGMNLLIRGKK